jgi:hypothetical protein
LFLLLSKDEEKFGLAWKGLFALEVFGLLSFLAGWPFRPKVDKLKDRFSQTVFNALYLPLLHF